MVWWQKEQYETKVSRLKDRMTMIKKVRSFFDKQNFLEVETPILQVSPGLEPHLHAFKTDLVSADQDTTVTRYLHTSPEFTMKKLLVAGLPRIYQICKTFRNQEGSDLHAPEFTMIEWYRAGATYRDLMRDCIDLFRFVCDDIFRFKGKQSNPHKEWEVITVCDAFEKYVGINLESVLDDCNAFRDLVRCQGIHVADDDQWDDVFFKIFLEKIEPNLGCDVPTIIYDYPISMAALSRPKADDPRFAERFEIYVCGIEIANAFGELTDPDIQLKRFEQDMDMKQAIYGKRYPIDDDFIQALKQGMPEAAGIALGIDRLAMLITDAECIDDVLWSPVV